MRYFGLRLVLCVFLPIFTLPPASILAQETAGIEQALASGSAKDLAVYFGSTVDIKLIDTQNVYGSAQAVALLEVFFKNHQPSSFTVLHRGSRDARSFLVGTLVTSREEFRVNLFLRSGGAVSEITQIQILRSSIK